MQKKFEISRMNIKGGCHSGRKEVTQNSKSDLLLELGSEDLSEVRIKDFFDLVFQEDHFWLVPSQEWMHIIAVGFKILAGGILQNTEQSLVIYLFALKCGKNHPFPQH